MTMKENILSDIDNIGNPALLNQVYEYLQLLKLNKSMKIKNQPDVLKFAGSLSSKDAKEISAIIENEFNEIEGDW